MDSGASGHMTGEVEAFASLEEHFGQVTFADNSKGEIPCTGKVEIRKFFHKKYFICSRSET